MPFSERTVASRSLAFHPCVTILCDPGVLAGGDRFKAQRVLPARA